jgi:hypothetical protein
MESDKKAYATTPHKLISTPTPFNPTSSIKDSFSYKKFLSTESTCESQLRKSRCNSNTKTIKKKSNEATTASKNHSTTALNHHHKS